MLVALVVLLVVGGAGYGLHVYRQRLAARPSYRIRTADLCLIRRAPWMTGEVVEQVRSSLAELPCEISVMDAASVDMVARCLASNPWVREVHYVRVDRPDPAGGSGLEVSLALRRPVAFVEIGEGPTARYYLVDREGVRLGDHAYEEPVLGDRVLLTISGGRGPAAGPGEVWADSAVVAAADVAHLFRRRVVEYNLSRVDVGRRIAWPTGDEPEIVLLTKRMRTRIVWGGPRNRRSEIREELTAAEKLSYLDFLHQSLGGLDGHAASVDLVERCWCPAASRPGTRRGRPVRG